MTLIDVVEIETKLSFAIRNGIPLTDKFVQSVRNGVISEFVLARLLIKDMDRESKTISVELQNQSGLDWMCLAPVSLCPYQTHHVRNLKEGEIDQALSVLQQETKDLQSTTENAGTLSDETLAGLTVRERWHIPLVMGKVVRGQRLRKPDTKIFQHVQANMKSDEDAARMKAVLLVDTVRARTSPVPVPVLARGNSSLLSGTASSLHKSMHAYNAAQKAVKPLHHKRGSKIATSTKAALARKKSQRTGAMADGVDEGSDFNFNRLLSGLSLLGTSLRVSFGLTAEPCAEEASVVAAVTPTVHYDAQVECVAAVVPVLTVEDVVPCSASVTSTTIESAQMLADADQSLSFDDTLTVLYPVPRKQPSQTKLLLYQPEEAWGNSAETSVKPKHAKRPSPLASSLLAFTSGLGGVGIGGAVVSVKRHTSFLQTAGLLLWSTKENKIAAEE